MKLEQGKRYLRRDGKVTGPLVSSSWDSYPFTDPVDYIHYTNSGEYFRRGVGHHQDLVAEYVGDKPNSQDMADKDARIAELETMVKGWEDKWDNCWNAEFMSRDAEISALKARVAELEEQHKALATDLIKALSDRDSLREQLDEARAELATYKQPKLVGSTWQGLHDDGVAGKLHDRPGALTKWFPAVVRRDTYQNPDGSTYVVATLEPVTEEKDV